VNRRDPAKWCTAEHIIHDPVEFTPEPPFFVVANYSHEKGNIECRLVISNHDALFIDMFCDVIASFGHCVEQIHMQTRRQLCRLIIEWIANALSEQKVFNPRATKRGWLQPKACE